MDQVELVLKVAHVLESLGVKYALVGSWGSGAWGEARYTQDIDILADLSVGDVKKLIAAFPPDEYYISAEAATRAVASRDQFNLIHGASAIKVDFMLPKRNVWGRTQLARRRKIELQPGLATYVAAPEDIIISKMMYYREGGSEKHLRDITGIMKLSGQMVDQTYINRWAEEFDLTEIWQAILRRLRGKG